MRINGSEGPAWTVSVKAPAAVRVAASRWQFIEALFHEAACWPPEEQKAHLLEWTEGDLSTTDEVLELLRAFASVEATAKTQVSLPSEATPEFIGRYRIERLLGHGGMGTIYLASDDQLPGREGKFFALKVIGKSLDSAATVQRFEEERQILAKLQHPHIALLIDGGVFTTSKGSPQPFFVMEYIEGSRLDRYCDEPDVSAADVLRLFLDLCDAISYAHRHFVLHRDIKPGNVLVTETGSLKLLDFGAFLTLSNQPDVTATPSQAWTLNYAAPETFAGVHASVAADIYSLGRLLYRLLAGELPQAQITLGRSGLELQKQTLPPLERRCGKRLSPSLRDDANAVIARATAALPEARYGSAEVLAEDIRRLLECKPIAAREDELRYTTVHFIVRNRLLVAVAMLAALAVAALMGVALVQRSRARRATHITQEGMIVQQQLAHALLSDYVEKLRDTSRSVQVQKQTILTAQQYLDDLLHSIPNPPISLQEEEIAAYTRLGQVLGSPYEQNLGDTAGARQALQRAIDVGQRLAHRDPHDRSLAQPLMLAELALSRVEFGDGHPQEAQRWLVPALATAQWNLADPKAAFEDRDHAGEVFETMADVDGMSGAANLHDDSSSRHFSELALDVNRKLVAERPSCVRCRRGIAIDEYKIASIEEGIDTPAALRDFAAGLAALDQMPPEEQHTERTERIRSALRQQYANVLLDANRTAEATTQLNEVVAHYRLKVEADPRNGQALDDLTTSLHDRIDMLRRVHHNSEALSDEHELLRTVEAHLALQPDNRTMQQFQVDALLNLARMEEAKGDHIAAAAHAKLGVALGQTLSASGPLISNADNALVYALLHQPGVPHDPAKALALARAYFASVPDPTAADTVSLADAEAANGMHSQARQLAQSVLAQHHGSPDKGPPSPVYAEAERLSR